MYIHKHIYVCVFIYIYIHVSYMLHFPSYHLCLWPITTFIDYIILHCTFCGWISKCAMVRWSDWSDGVHRKKNPNIMRIAPKCPNETNPWFFDKRPFFEWLDDVGCGDSVPSTCRYFVEPFKRWNPRDELRSAVKSPKCRRATCTPPPVSTGSRQGGWFHTWGSPKWMVYNGKSH